MFSSFIVMFIGGLIATDFRIEWAYGYSINLKGVFMCFFAGVTFMSQARGRVRVGEEGYHLASLGPLPPPMAASQAFPKCRHASLPVVPFCPCERI